MFDCPRFAGFLEGEAGTAGVAGIAGLAGAATPPTLRDAGVARVAGRAAVAGVTGRLSSPTTSPRKCVALCAATFDLAVSEACGFGICCAASSDGTTTIAATSMILRSMCYLQPGVLQTAPRGAALKTPCGAAE